MSEYTIYKIICKNNLITDCYVGQTMNFKLRGQQHQNKCNNPKSDRYNIKLYTFIRDNGGFDNWDIKLIATYNCVDKYEAYKFERLHYEELNSTLNDKYPARTKKESFALYRINNKDKLKDLDKIYRDNNVEKEKARNALYRANNVEKEKARHALYNANNVEKRAEHNIKNADKIKAQRAEYRTLNADKIKAKSSEVKTCDCGKTYTHQHYLRHCRTQYHLKNIINVT